MGHHDVETRPHRTRATARVCPDFIPKMGFYTAPLLNRTRTKGQVDSIKYKPECDGPAGIHADPASKEQTSSRTFTTADPGRESINRTRHEIVMDTVGSDESFARAPAAGPGRATHACAGGQRVTGRAVSATNRNVHIRGPGRTRNAHNSNIFLTQEEEPGAPEWNRNSPIRTATASDVQAHTSSSNSKVSKILVVQLVIIIKLILL